MQHNKRTKNKNVVIIGGGVGSSIFTRGIKDYGVNLTTIVSSFDDGGSTGFIRRDYGGIAVGDLRQCILGNLNLDEETLHALNYRFGKGHLFGVSVANVLLRAFLDIHASEQEGMHSLHKVLGLKHQVAPVSYTFAKLTAELDNRKILKDQAKIARYVGKNKAKIKSLQLKPQAVINPDAEKALLKADYIIFAPGHFFTSILPNIYVKGFAQAWNKSKARKMWFVNLLAWQGQDDHYTLVDHLRWFQNILGQVPFDEVVVNKEIPDEILSTITNRFTPLKITDKDKAYLKGSGMELVYADLVSTKLTKQNPNDPVPRAPLRHNIEKIKKFFKNKLS